LRLAVFASGGGTNFQAILDAIGQGALSAEVALCVSNRPDAGALDRARRHDIPTAVLDPSAPAHEAMLLDTLETHAVDFIALAGYLRKIPSGVVDRFRHRMTNIHPALLPAFGGEGMYGMHVHRAVLDYGARWSGATVHLVDESYDTGPIVLQEPVPVYPDDTPDDLAARVLAVEHRLYPEALRLFTEGRIRCEGRTVHIEPTAARSAAH
jgi:phosphoribosylglycinamide formyltransferase-1